MTYPKHKRFPMYYLAYVSTRLQFAHIMDDYGNLVWVFYRPASLR